ncbi:hypothetical protein GGR53DRAFT_141107 [Hypoxylon sp. FL1150]|nr:hypothetical protein GGR53DRAFT_141107 [Hypoxylon sp. FL1150]
MTSITPSLAEEPDIDRGVQLISIYSSQCGISFLFITLRLWARLRIRGLGWDDLFMTATWVLFVALTIIVGFIGTNGGTRHVYYLEQYTVQYVLKLNYIAQPFGIAAVGTGKIAVGFTILRILGSTSKYMKRIMITLMILTGIITTVTAIFTFTQCEIPAALWEPSIRSTTFCYDPSIQSNFSIFSASWNAAVDFVLALSPASFIWRLHLTTRKRIGLIALLGCGMFSGVCAAFKTAQLVSLAARSDLTWETFNLFAWVSAEIFVIIICGSVPALKPIWDCAFRQGAWSVSRRYATGQYMSEEGPRKSPFGQPRCIGHELRSFENLTGTISSVITAREGDRRVTVSGPMDVDNIRVDIPTQDEDEVIHVTHSVHWDWEDPAH